MRGCIALAAALLVAGPAAAQDALEEAQERFDKGVDLYNQGNFEGALVEFRAAYEAKPHSKVRYNVGMTLFKLNRYVEAQAELEAYLEEGGDGVEQERRQELLAVLGEIVSYIGMLFVHCDVEGASLYVDGKLVTALPVEEAVKLDVGEYYIEVRAEGYRTFEEQITLPGGKLVTRTVALEPLPVDEVGDCTSDEDCGRYEGCHAGLCVPGELVKGRKLMIAGGVLLAGGLSLVVGGSVLLALGVDPVKDPYLWSGGVMFLAGLGITIASLPVLIVGARRNRKLHMYRPESASLTLVPLLAPGTIGLGVTTSW